MDGLGFVLGAYLGSREIQGWSLGMSPSREGREAPPERSR